MSKWASSPAGQEQYQAMPVTQRLELLQQPGVIPQGNDLMLLRLLRARREREAAYSAPVADQMLSRPKKQGYYDATLLPTRPMQSTFQNAANALK